MEKFNPTENRADVQGRMVHYTVAGHGPAIFILHGWGATSASWENVQRLLASRGFSVIVPDLPGFGKTPPPTTVWGVRDYAKFVGAFASVLKADRFFLVGHSFGGAAAAQFALLEPDRVEKLALVGAAAVRRKPGIRKKIIGYIAKILGLAIYFSPQNVRQNVKLAGYKLLQSGDYLRTYGIMKDVFKRVITEDLSPLIAQISVPALVLWGEQDKMTPIKDGRFIADQLPEGTLLTFPGKGHNLHVEAAEELSEAISRFFA